MYTAYDIYVKFKQMESLCKNKNVNIPKNLDRLSQEKINKLAKVADYFNTIWQNIDVESYLKIGFEKWKSFDIDKLDDKRIFRKYISNDKKIKNNFEEISTTDINKSIIHIQSNAGNAMEYCNDNKIIRDPINDFVQNKIDPITLMFLIEKRYLYPVREEEKLIISQFLNNYQDIKHVMYKHYEFIIRNL